MRIGSQEFRVAAVLTNEPDRLSAGFSLGPHVIVSQAALKRTGLVTIGSLIDYTYRIAAPIGFSLTAFKADAAKQFPDAGWRIRGRDNAAPGLKRFVEQITMFLTLVGLTALAVGGVGAGQAISTFLDRKRSEIAVMKALGADGALIFLTFFVQVMGIALLAVATGLILAALLPFAVRAVYGAEIPVPASYGIYPSQLVLAAVFGILSAAAFAVPPLARAHEIAPANLFRDLVVRSPTRARWPYLAGAGIAGGLIHVAGARPCANAAVRRRVSGRRRGRAHHPAPDCRGFAHGFAQAAHQTAGPRLRWPISRGPARLRLAL